MANINWLLEADRTTVQRYQAMRQRINQIEREWVSVPFHWDEAQLAHVRSVSEAYQAICKHEADWRFTQYQLFQAAEREAGDDQEYAAMQHTAAIAYWQELSEWRDEAMYARLLVQSVERGAKVYAEYQARQQQEHAAYMQRIGLA